MAVKRILFLHYGELHIRGSEKVLLDILGRLDKGKFEAVLVCNSAMLAAQAEKLGIKTYIFSWPEVMIDKGYVRLQFVKLLIAIHRLIKIVRNEFMDMIVCNCGLVNQAGLHAARLSHIPVVVYVHAPYTKRYIYLYGLNRTEKAIFVSNAIRNSMTTKAFFKSEVVIHNGIDIDKYCPPSTRNRLMPGHVEIDENKIIIGQVGSLIRRKGVDVLIEAGRLLADKGLNFHIVLVGSGADEQLFQQLTHDLGMSSYVTFFGNYDAPEYFYQNIFDINVLASRSEAFGLTLAEGSACCLPCVGSNVGGIPEVIRHDETGYLFTSGDVKDLADKLELLINGPSLREEMGRKGREYMADSFSLSKQINHFHKVLVEAFM